MKKKILIVALLILATTTSAIAQIAGCTSVFCSNPVAYPPTFVICGDGPGRKYSNATFNAGATMGSSDPVACYTGVGSGYVAPFNISLINVTGGSVVDMQSGKDFVDSRSSCGGWNFKRNILGPTYLEWQMDTINLNCPCVQGLGYATYVKVATADEKFGTVAWESDYSTTAIAPGS